MAEPPGNEGLNRFDWNLRYNPPFQVPPGVGLFAALGPGFAGPQAPPGTYEVTVSSGSWKATQPLIVRSKPGATATEADYDDQLALALRIGARTRTLYELLATTRDLQKQAGTIEQIPAVASDRQIRSQLQSLAEQLAAIENGLAQTRATGSQDTAPSRLDSQFIGLYGRVIAHDGRPTEPEQARFRDLDPLLTKLQGALDGVIHTTLPAVNKLLASRRVPTIVAR